MNACSGITVVLLALVLTGCACSVQLGLTGMGVATTVLTGDPIYATSMGIDAGICLVNEAAKEAVKP